MAKRILGSLVVVGVSGVLISSGRADDSLTQSALSTMRDSLQMTREAETYIAESNWVGSFQNGSQTESCRFVISDSHNVSGAQSDQMTFDLEAGDYYSNWRTGAIESPTSPSSGVVFFSSDGGVLDLTSRYSTGSKTGTVSSTKISLSSASLIDKVTMTGSLGLFGKTCTGLEKKEVSGSFSCKLSTTETWLPAKQIRVSITDSDQELSMSLTDWSGNVISAVGAYRRIWLPSDFGNDLSPMTNAGVNPEDVDFAAYYSPMQIMDSSAPSYFAYIGVYVFFDRDGNELGHSGTYASNSICQ